MTDAASGPTHPHPSPHRNRISLVLLIVALVAGPGAWIVDLLGAYALANGGCLVEGDASRTAMLILGVACLAGALAAAWVGLRQLRTVHGEHPGGQHELVEVGEGRSRFLATWALVGGVSFAIPILIDIAGLAMVPPCAG